MQLDSSYGKVVVLTSTIPLFIILFVCLLLPLCVRIARSLTNHGCGFIPSPACRPKPNSLRLSPWQTVISNLCSGNDETKLSLEGLQSSLAAVAEDSSLQKLCFAEVKLPVYWFT